MNSIAILAKTVATASRTARAEQGAIVPIDLIWGYITSLNLLEAVTFISFGTVCLFYGWRVFKVLVVISFALLGLAFGITLTDKLSNGNGQFLGGMAGLGVMAVASVPLMRWAVSILGAVAGGILTAGLWYACKLPEQYIWAGALIGIVAGGMISFIVFRIAVMLFSSMGGSLLIVTGLLALLYLWPATAKPVEGLFFTAKWFLPLALLVPTAVGIFLQNRFIKGAHNWSV